jgi:hypothetical protein
MRNLWIVGLLVALRSAHFVDAATAEPTKSTAIEIVVVNEAAVSEEVLAEARVQATRIYAPMGIKPVWTDSIAAGPSPAPEIDRRLTMKIVSHSKIGHVEDVMGFAFKGGNMAYVFYTRVKDFAQQRQISVAKILGHALAHEMGHLLMPQRRHSLSGIMRTNWDRDHELTILKNASSVLAFEADEAETIRSSVRQPRIRD